MSDDDRRIAEKIWPMKMRLEDAKLYVRQRAALRSLGTRALAHDPKRKRK